MPSGATTGDRRRRAVPAHRRGIRLCAASRRHRRACLPAQGPARRRRGPHPCPAGSRPGRISHRPSRRRGSGRQAYSCCTISSCCTCARTGRPPGDGTRQDQRRHRAGIALSSSTVEKHVNSIFGKLGLGEAGAPASGRSDRVPAPPAGVVVRKRGLPLINLLMFHLGQEDFPAVGRARPLALAASLPRGRELAAWSARWTPGSAPS